MDYLFYRLAYIIELHIDLHLAELIGSISQRTDHVTRLP